MPENAPPAVPSPTPPAKLTPNTKGEDPGPADAIESKPAPPKAQWLPIALGVGCAVLLLLVMILWGRISDRDRTIDESRNRLVQVQGGGALLQVQANEAKTETARLQKLLEEANAKSVQHMAESAKAKADAAKIQAQLEESRATANDFQTRMAEAKVASLRHQGEVETAQAQTAVMLTQLTQATTERTELQAQLAQAKTTLDEVQKKLRGAEQEITLLKNPPARKR